MDTLEPRLPPKGWKFRQSQMQFGLKWHSRGIAVAWGSEINPTEVLLRPSKEETDETQAIERLIAQAEEEAQLQVILSTIYNV